MLSHVHNGTAAALQATQKLRRATKRDPLSRDMSQEDLRFRQYDKSSVSRKCHVGRSTSQEKLAQDGTMFIEHLWQLLYSEAHLGQDRKMLTCTPSPQPVYTFPTASTCIPSGTPAST